jgi:hypothetical protein
LTAAVVADTIETVVARKGRASEKGSRGMNSVIAGRIERIAEKTLEGRRILARI